MPELEPLLQNVAALTWLTVGLVALAGFVNVRFPTAYSKSRAQAQKAGIVGSRQLAVGSKFKIEELDARWIIILLIS